MSKVNIFERFLSVGILKPKLKWFFKLKLKPKFVLLNRLPAVEAVAPLFPELVEEGVAVQVRRVPAPLHVRVQLGQAGVLRVGGLPLQLQPRNRVPGRSVRLWMSMQWTFFGPLFGPFFELPTVNFLAVIRS